MHIPTSKIILAVLVVLAAYFIVTTVIHIVLNPLFWIVAAIIVGGYLYLTHKPHTTT